MPKCLALLLMLIVASPAHGKNEVKATVHCSLGSMVLQLVYYDLGEKDWVASTLYEIKESWGVVVLSNKKGLLQHDNKREIFIRAYTKEGSAIDGPFLFRVGDQFFKFKPAKGYEADVDENDNTMLSLMCD